MTGERVINLIPLLGYFGDNGVIRFAEIRVNILALLSKALKGKANTVVNALAAVFTILSVLLVTSLMLSH